MLDTPFRYIFGPVISRRLGRSLGVDVVPFKTCTYDCVYCQLGRTTERTLERRAYVPLDAVMAELRRKLEAGVDADYITIAGSGEPTLYADLSPLIAAIKGITPIPVAVITNGSLLWMPEVQDSLLEADVVVPSLDAGDRVTFERVNRPCPGIAYDQMVEGLAAFRARYNGQYWLEVFVLSGITDTEAEVCALADLIHRIKPDRVQLNTVARPAPGSDIVPMPREVLDRIARRLGANIEVIAHYEAPAASATGTASPEDVLGVVKRHPCMIEDIAEGLGISLPQAAECIADLLQRHRVCTESRAGKTFYLAMSESPPSAT